MAYENTDVPVSKSQEGIRKLLLGRAGSKVAFISDPPREGFEASVVIDGTPYRIRIFGECKEVPTEKLRNFRGGATRLKATTDKAQRDFLEKEERRIWRVLYYHMKAMFESADSGVMEMKEILLPFIVTNSGKTIAECLVPSLERAIEHNPARMLGSGN